MSITAKEMNYNLIKRVAKDAGVSYRHMIALAPQNDPFYCGTPGDIDKALWFAQLLRDAGLSNTHLRRVHYWAVSQSPQVTLPNRITWNKKKDWTDTYINNDACWKYLCQASKLARYLGYVDVEDIVDNKNPNPHVYAKYTTDEPDYYIDVPYLDNWYSNTQHFNLCNILPYHLEIWCEKSTMNDVLLPVCEQYRANLVTFEGEVSVTACQDLINRAEEAGKPVRVFYISDFDPAGKSMPVAMSRKIEFLNRDELLDIRVKQITLTAEQVYSYNLPRIPIKESERRAERFENVFGVGATELDALEAIHPGELADIVSEAMEPYWSEEADRQLAHLESQLQDELDRQINNITTKYAKEIDAIRGLVHELKQIEIDMADYTLDTFAPATDEDEGWLFDSQRDYLEQLQMYKLFKAGETL